jgi:hypothetical protein
LNKRAKALIFQKKYSWNPGLKSGAIETALINQVAENYLNSFGMRMGLEKFSSKNYYLGFGHYPAVHKQNTEIYTFFKRFNMQGLGVNSPSNSIIIFIVACAAPEASVFVVEINSSDRAGSTVSKSQYIAHLF